MLIFSSKKRAFTIVELMVAIVIFTLGLMGTYALIQSANSVSLRSKDEIIVANILRENIELVKNMRDSNWMRSQYWNRIDQNAVKIDGDTTILQSSEDTSKLVLNPGYYTFENNYSDIQTIRLRSISSAPTENTIKDELAHPDTSVLRLCLDEKARFTHDCASGRQKTPFFSYIQVAQHQTTNASGEAISLTGAYDVSAYVYATDSGIRLYDMHTVITDWK